MAERPGRSPAQCSAQREIAVRSEQRQCTAAAAADLAPAPKIVPPGPHLCYMTDSEPLLLVVALMDASSK
jgi:hypothetical protein